MDRLGIFPHIGNSSFHDTKRSIKCVNGNKRLDWNELNSTRLNWIRLDEGRLDLTKLDWIGLD